MAKKKATEYHHRVRILDPQGGADHIKSFGADLTAARNEFERARGIHAKRTIYLERINMDTGQVRVLDRSIK